MKLLRGKNWFELQLTKRKGLYVGPLWEQEKEADGTPQYKLISFMTRRFKLRFLRDNHTKQWKLSFGGLWCSEGTTDEYINYKIDVSKFVDES